MVKNSINLIISNQSTARGGRAGPQRRRKEGRRFRNGNGHGSGNGNGGCRCENGSMNDEMDYEDENSSADGQSNEMHDLQSSKTRTI